MPAFSLWLKVILSACLSRQSKGWHDVGQVAFSRPTDPVRHPSRHASAGWHPCLLPQALPVVKSLPQFGSAFAMRSSFHARCQPLHAGPRGPSGSHDFFHALACEKKKRDPGSSPG